MKEVYTHRYAITAADMDQHYRMTPHAVLLYFQDCFARHMTCHHVAAFDLVKQQKMWVFTEYDAELTPVDTLWTEEIDVSLWVSEITSLRIYCDFRIRKTDGGAEVAHGCGQMCLLDIPSRRLEQTALIADRLTVVPDLTVSHRKQRFPKGTDIIVSNDHKVNRLDVDFNGHVNNRSYLSIALVTMPDDFLPHHALRHISIHWLHETYLSDTLHCDLYAIPSDDMQAAEFVHTLRSSDGAEAAQVHTLWRPLTHIPDIAEVLVRK